MIYHHTCTKLNSLVHSIALRNIWNFKLLKYQRSCASILCQTFISIKYGETEIKCLFVYLIHHISYIFNQFDKKNATFMLRLINTGGTSGQNFTGPRRFKIIYIYVWINIKRFTMERNDCLMLRSFILLSTVLALWPMLRPSHYTTTFSANTLWLSIRQTKRSILRHGLFLQDHLIYIQLVDTIHNRYFRSQLIVIGPISYSHVVIVVKYLI